MLGQFKQLIYFSKMILAKIKEEELSNFPLNRKQKLLNRIKNPFRTTAFTIHKKKAIDQAWTLSPDEFSSRAISPEPRIACEKSSKSDNPQQSCSNFMKSYVQKLKRQRKRDKKRLSLLHQGQNNQKDPFLGCDIAPLPLIHNGKQQILIFEKMTPSSFRPSAIQPTPSESTINSQRIAGIIEQIKKYKAKGNNDKSSQHKKRMVEYFPVLQKKVDKNLSKLRINVDSLDPWEGDNQYNDLLEQYK